MRKVFACLFALAALLIVAGQALVISADGFAHGTTHATLASIAVMSGITAVYLFRPRERWEASLVCPSCHQPAVLTPCVLGQPRPNLAALLLGGIIVTVLIQQSQPRRFRCQACAAESSRRTLGSWLAVAWCLFLVFLVVVEAASE